MKAVQLQAYGGNDVVHVVDDAAQPTLGPGQVLVKVYAAGVNPSDWKIRQGLFQAWRPLTFPATLGGDFVGVVSELSAGVIGLKVGDRVFGRALAGGVGSGSFADFLVVPANLLALAPSRIGDVEAAALPLAGVSAWQALSEHIGVCKGQKILIHGGAGGIGSLAVQIAKHFGAYVATTAGATDLEYVRSLGADKVIDYRAERFEDVVQDMDAVFDTVGGETYARSFAVIKPGGVLVTMSHPDGESPVGSSVRVVAQQTEVTAERLTKVAALVDQGVLSVHISKVFPFEQVREALTYQETGQPRGKVVLRVA